MIVFCIVLSILVMLLLVLNIIFIKAGVKASRKIQAFEDFYEGTIEDLDSVIKMVNGLLKRQLLSDDNDVQNFHRVIGITHDILLGYRKAGEDKEKTEK